MPVLLRVAAMRRAQRVAHRGRQPAQAADREQTDVVLHHLAELGRAGTCAASVISAVDLARRPVPVLASRTRTAQRYVMPSWRLDSTMARTESLPTRCP